MAHNKNSFGTHDQLSVDGKSFHFHNLKKLSKDVGRLPYSARILLENLLRFEDQVTARKSDIDALIHWKATAEPDTEIQFRPARILLQDFTGVPAVADLAAMRGAVQKLGGDPNRINPLQPANLVIDHSVQVDFFGTPDAHQKNNEIEFERNRERYEFLKWGQSSFQNFGVVPPDTGIVHQVNLEYLARVAWTAENPEGFPKGTWVYPDSLVGTDSHTTMINGLGVLGWGVGGIEAEAAMLGQPITMLIPQVVGFKLANKLPPGTTATDLVLTVTQMLRKKGVVGKFVEFFGPGLSNLTLADRATIANMAPEYGATCGIFPVDKKTVEYMQLTGRGKHAALIEAYYKATGMWFDDQTPEAQYSDRLELDMSKVEPSLAGPSRPQDRVTLSQTSQGFKQALPEILKKSGGADASEKRVEVKDPQGNNYSLGHGSTVIAAITSCTNTSNPAVLVAAGLVARKANALGIKVKPWVKTSLAPGSKVVTNYLKAMNLLPDLEKQGFHVVGYGCTTCIGNSGPLPDHIVDAVNKGNLVVTSVLSGNRNFEGRISPHVRANYLASPPLVVAYALAGDLNIDLTRDPLGKGKNGPVFLKDVWPSKEEIDALIQQHVKAGMYEQDYADMKGPKEWQVLQYPKGDLYKWDKDSTYIKEPPFFEGMKKEPDAINDIKKAHCLVLLQDSVTTDHISPAGSIKEDSPAGKYLKKHGVSKADFNSFGARRGNHEVMVRGTFANIRIKNQLVPGVEGGVTIHIPSGKQMSIYDASMEYQTHKQDLIVIAGKEYGTGSSRDWAAKGTLLLGVKAVIAQSFERIHRSNLVGMGVLPLQFKNGEGYESLGLDGTETFDIGGLNQLQAGQRMKVRATHSSGKTTEFEVAVRVDTPNELEYYKHGGILKYVLRQILKNT